MMSEYQIQHVVHQLEHLFSRFTPAVSAGQWSVKFVPILEPGEEEYKPDPVLADPQFARLPHNLISVYRCWCDNEAAASHNFGQYFLSQILFIKVLGIILPFYVIEVRIERQSASEYRAEDGLAYIRKHGQTERCEGQEQVSYLEG